MDFVERLRTLGFSSYEAKAYQLLVTHKNLKAMEISRLAEIPQGRVYGVLEELKLRGFCFELSGAVKRYEVTDPETAFRILVVKQQRALEDVQVLTQELKTEFEGRSEQLSETEFVKVLSSRQSQVNQFDELILNSKHALLSFNKKPYATGFKRSRADIDKASKPLKAAVRRGVVIKAIFEAEDEDVEDFGAMIDYYQGIGEEVRVVDRLPMKMLLCDGEQAMVSLQSAKGSNFKLTSMVVANSDLTKALEELFLGYWNG